MHWLIPTTITALAVLLNRCRLGVTPRHSKRRSFILQSAAGSNAPVFIVNNTWVQRQIHYVNLLSLLWECWDNAGLLSRLLASPPPPPTPRARTHSLSLSLAHTHSLSRTHPSPPHTHIRTQIQPHSYRKKEEWGRCEAFANIILTHTHTYSPYTPKHTYTNAEIISTYIFFLIVILLLFQNNETVTKA